MMHERDILQAAIARWGKDAQTKMVLEEMSELQKEICKMWRGKENTANIAEEVADVEIMLNQLKLMLDIEDTVRKYKSAKLIRLQERLGYTPEVWWLKKPVEGEPEGKSCQNCARGCKKTDPFASAGCPYWAKLEDLLIETDTEGRWKNEQGT